MSMDALPSMALHFELGGRSFGVTIEAVRELLQVQGLEPVADAPPEMVGMMRVREQLVPVLDLRSRLRLPTLAEITKVGVLERDGVTLGIALERVHAVILAEPDEIQPAGTRADDGLVSGVLDYEGRLVTMLDLGSYFGWAAERATAHREAHGTDDQEAERLQQLHLTFRTGGERLSFPVERVQEILEYTGHTHVPLAPSWVSGVLNLRGAVIPIVPLAEELGLPSTAEPTRVVILEANWNGEVHLVGMLVDDVEQVLPIDDGDVKAPPRMGLRMRPEFVCGVYHNQGASLFLLDADHVLDLDALCSGGSA